MFFFLSCDKHLVKWNFVFYGPIEMWQLKGAWRSMSKFLQEAQVPLMVMKMWTGMIKSATSSQVPDEMLLTVLEGMCVTVGKS